jgi:omega-amidase
MLGEKDRVSLMMGTNNHAGCYGGWEIVCPDLQPGKEYSFKAKASLQGIPFPVENLSPEVFFYSSGDKRPMETRYIQAESQGSTEVFYRYAFDVPEKTSKTVIRLFLRWTAYGHVRFSGLSLKETHTEQADTAMKVAVSAGWKQRDTLEGNLEKCLDDIRYAAGRGAQFILFPEVILSWHVSGTSRELARPVPGKETERIARCARSNNIGVALSMKELNGKLYHNTGLVFDPEGNLVLKYRKIHLPAPEHRGGTTPGNRYPVADVPGGKMGMQICYDNVFPEGARMLARKGAEIILLPIMGDPRAVDYPHGDSRWEWSPEKWDLIMRMRALDNHVWYVIARNRGPGSCIVNPAGEIVASMKEGEQMLFGQVDTSYRIKGNFYQRYWRDRLPSTYSLLDDTDYKLLK